MLPRIPSCERERCMLTKFAAGSPSGLVALDSLRQNRALLIQRARKLERMELATEVEVGRWSLSPRAESALRELGERGDIIKTMHRALTREGLADSRPIAGYVLHGEKTSERSSAGCSTRAWVATRWASGCGW
jgi:Protein of unknown function (DUF3363)